MTKWYFIYMSSKIKYIFMTLSAKRDCEDRQIDRFYCQHCQPLLAHNATIFVSLGMRATTRVLVKISQYGLANLMTPNQDVRFVFNDNTWGSHVGFQTRGR